MTTSTKFGTGESLRFYCVTPKGIESLTGTEDGMTLLVSLVVV